MESDKLYLIGTLTLNLGLFLTLFFLCRFLCRNSKEKKFSNQSILKKTVLLTPISYIFSVVACFGLIRFSANTTEKQRTEKILKSKNLTVIVLGNPAANNGQPSQILKSRLDKTLEVCKTHNNINLVIVTGAAVYNKFVEAIVMKRYLIANGIDKNKIRLETKARNTIENAKFSTNILRNLKIKNVVVITSEYHQKRAKKIFDCYEINCAVVAPQLTFWAFLKYFPFYVVEKFLTFEQ